MGIMDIFAKIEAEHTASTGKPEWLIIGLGNPGMIYEKTPDLSRSIHSQNRNMCRSIA